MWVTRVRNNIVAETIKLAGIIAAAVLVGLSSAIIFALVISRSASGLHAVAVHRGWSI